MRSIILEFGWNLQTKFNQILQPEEAVGLEPLIKEINKEYRQAGKGIYIEKIAGGYQLLSKEEYHIYVQRMFNKYKKLKLSRASQEALAIIAYRQPVSKVEVESIRGVECGSVINTLMERELITVKGRQSSVGRPLLFGTTLSFLESFGLDNISHLPKLKELSEITSQGGFAEQVE